ncbi:hypothetical protein GGR42_003403 [Saonia flava]|uniref:Uncharacterized protein n=1 Tax=Saonia flava TaxID=523696 RepID=A0A846R4K1_9FLAO|nr:hypothetical protein [Saonia flava]NJB72905.1 hypothetical protein [Saonia flava]
MALFLRHFIKQSQTNLKRIIILLLLIFTYQTNLLGQNKIVGKIEFYKSSNSEWAELESSSDRQIELLNSRRHKIKIAQGESSTEMRTDSTGFFLFMLNSPDSLKIAVNEKSKVLNGLFKISVPPKNDTILFKISDKKLSLYKDSIQSPVFFKKYNEKQAELDFKNDNAQFLGSGQFIPQKVIKKRKRLSEQHNFEYKYVFGCIQSRAERRIAYRYNEVMKKLVGIKNVW